MRVVDGTIRNTGLHERLEGLAGIANKFASAIINAIKERRLPDQMSFLSNVTRDFRDMNAFVSGRLSSDVLDDGSFHGW